MSLYLGVLTIASGVKNQFQGAPSQGARAILIGNESGLTCTITMQGGGVQKTLYPSTVDWFAVNQGFTGTIEVVPTAILTNAASFPASELLFDAVGPSDPEQSSQYPLSLQRNTNIGNSVSATVVSASSVQNDGNGTAVTIVEATVGAEASSAVTLTAGGILTLGNASHNGEVILTGSGAQLTNPGTTDLGGGNVVSVSPFGDFKVASTGSCNLQVPIEVNMASVHVAGSVSGSADLYEYFTGAVKRLLLVYTNLRDAAAIVLSLPINFSIGAFFQISDTSTMSINFVSSGSPQNCSVQNTIAATGGTKTGETAIKGWSQGSVNGAFDSIQLNFTTGVAGGFLLAEGS